MALSKKRTITNRDFSAVGKLQDLDIHYVRGIVIFTQDACHSFEDQHVTGRCPAFHKPDSQVLTSSGKKQICQAYILTEYNPVSATALFAHPIATTAVTESVGVVTGPACEQIASRTAIQIVLPYTAEEHIVAVTAVEKIITGPAIKAVVPGSP